MEIKPIIDSEVSVVIPTCKVSNFLWESIDSVLVADLVSAVKEIVVVPNAGKNNSTLAEGIRRRYQGSRLIVAERTSNVILPIFTNWNQSIQFVNGSVIHLMHDDDLLFPCAYEKINELIHRWPTASLYYIGSEMFGERTGSAVIGDHDQIWNEAALKLATGNHLLNPGVFFRRSHFCGFDETLKFTADWKAWYQAADIGLVVTSPLVGARYRVHPSNTTSSLSRTGIIVREPVAVGIKLSDDFEREHGYCPGNPVSFGANLGHSEVISCASRRDLRAALFYLKLAISAQFSFYAIARTFKHSLIGYLRTYRS